MRNSIIVTFYDNVNILLACITHILVSKIDWSECELIIVNDNPAINLAHFIREKNVRIVEQGKNTGFSGAANYGAGVAGGENLVFVDSDILVTRHWLKALQETQAAVDDCGCVSANILTLSTGKIEYFGLFLFHFDTIKPFRGGFPRNPFVEQDQPMQMVPSGCMLVSRENFDAAGGFNTEMFNSHSDLDLSLTMNELGKTNVVCADAVVYHRGAVSGTIRFSEYPKARSIFYSKWGNRNDNKKAECVLSGIYRSNTAVPESGSRYLLLDMGVGNENIIECFLNTFAMRPADRYSIGARGCGDVLLWDVLHWELCNSRVPMIFFINDYLRLEKNHHWFSCRRNKNDLIADINGNIVPARLFAQQMPSCFSKNERESVEHEGC